MNTITEFIESGIIQLYVLGMAGLEEQQEMERMASLHPEVEEAINMFSEAIELYARKNAIDPPPALKSIIMAAVLKPAAEREESKIKQPAMLHAGSRAEDYIDWLGDPAISLPADSENIHINVISKTKQVMTAIVWIKKELPCETHHDQLESFLVVEGSCEFYVEDDMYKLKTGDFFTVPLHKKHKATITSKQPCKVILQRITVAA